MILDHEQKQERIEACRELYIKYGGTNHDAIEREMRALGHADFHRRSLYRRFERGRSVAGWVETYGWKRLLPKKSSGFRVPGFGSPKGTKIIAQGNADAVGSDPGFDATHDPDPAGVAQTAAQVAPLQGANDVAPFPGVTLASLAHPRLLSVSPSATGKKPFSTNSTNSKNSTNSTPDDPFRQWLKRVSPGMNWDTKHHQYICDHLARVTSGECKRLMIFIPPRHGKSELVTVRYAGWRIKQDPSMNVIIGSYNQRLANRFSRKIKRALTDDAALDASLKGTNNKAQGKAEGCNPGFGDPHDPDPVRVEQTGAQVAPLQGANDDGPYPGVMLASLAHPRLLSLSPSATGMSESAAEEDAKLRGSSSVGCGFPSNSTNSSSQNLEPQTSNLEPKTPSVFPFTRPRNANTEAEWETAKGGGLRAVGVGAGVTGFGASLIVVDDPVKSRAEAESETYRDRVWEWFNDDLYTRLEPDGAIVLIQTRWHEDDLAGRLLREMHEENGEHWDVINLPALAEGVELRIADRGSRIEEQEPVEAINPQSAFRNPQSTDPLNRVPGQALWPERFDVEKLERLRHKLGSYSFASLYQQRPVPAEGGMFKRAWFKFVSAPPPNLKWKRAWDLGVTATDTSDFTASVRVAYDENEVLYIDRVFRARIEYPDQRKRILAAIQSEPDTIEHGIEATHNGIAVVQDLLREPTVRGRALKAIKVRDPKIARTLPLVTLAEQGRLRLVRGAWNDEFIHEATAFPSGTHDDQLDAASLALKMHQKTGGGKLYGF